MMADFPTTMGSNGGLYHPDYPDEWERRSLYSLAEWVNGLAFRDIQFSRFGMPVIKIAEIKDGISGQTKFTVQTFDDSVRVRPGDLLFSWSGQPETSIDSFWWRGPEGWLNQHIFRVTPIKGIDSTFIFYLLRYLKPNFVAIARNKQTTGLGHVTKRDLENIEAAYPEIPEQRAIAHILGTLDDKIELNRRMNQTLEAIAQAIFKSWFVDFEPVRAKMEGRWRRGESLPGLPAHLYDLFPDRLVESELGEIPEGWQNGTLGDVSAHPHRPAQPADINPDTPYIALDHMPRRSIVLG
ncbi:MAG: restriction endonuclease subunit S [Thermaerobacter sp.]|nr:restriction endonuclease subunit S [Thermaerobacter sp.]